ncbi:hypothetical protein, partial [Xanthomonas arboricola]
TPATGYDAAGRLRGYRYSLVRNEQGSGMTTPEGYTHTYRYTYQGAETYLTQQVIGTSTHKDFKTSNSTSAYDAWGKLLSVRENTPGGKVYDRRPVRGWMCWTPRQLPTRSIRSRRLMPGKHVG